MHNYVIALYIRLSVEDSKTDSYSIANQRIALRKYAESLDVDGEMEIVELVDNGYSGTNFERPAVQELLERVRSYHVDCIIVKDFSRFGRNSIETGYFIEQVFPLYHTRFISVNDSFDSANYKGDTGGLDVAFKYLIGEYYSMDLSKKSKTAKYAKMKRGEYQSKICCYGYKKGSNGRLEIDEEVAQTVKLIFDLSLQGCNAQQIVEALYEKEIPTPGEYKVSRGNKTHDVSRCHHIWSRSTVLRMLVDERYMGTYVIGKRTVREIGGTRSRLKDESEWFKIPNHHPAIIDKTVFERVQAQLMHFKSEKKNFAEYPLRSKVFCGCCGHGMARHRKNPIFSCDFTRIDGSFDCHGLQIEESALETCLFAIISKQAQVILNMDNLADTHDLQMQLTEKSWCGKQIAEYEEQKQRLYEAYCRKEIELADFTERKAEYDAELCGLKQTFTTLSMQTTQAQKSSAQKAEIQKLAETIAGESRLSSTLTDALLDKVVVYPNKQLEIVWKLKDFCVS